MVKQGFLTAAFCIGVAFNANAADIQVTVTGIDDPGGRIGCALHSATTSFPMGSAPLDMVWIATPGESTVCVFEGVAPGTYAVAVSNDLNGNRITDTNFFGIPTEEWGVSRNARPTMRPPEFAEASFDVGQAPVALTVEVD